MTNSACKHVCVFLKQVTACAVVHRMPEQVLRYRWCRRKFKRVVAVGSSVAMDRWLIVRTARDIQVETPKWNSNAAILGLPEAVSKSSYRCFQASHVYANVAVDSKTSEVIPLIRMKLRHLRSTKCVDHQVGHLMSPSRQMLSHES